MVTKISFVKFVQTICLDYGSIGIRSNGVNADRIKSGLMTEKMIKKRAKSKISKH